jgi:hypothetical protein
VHRLAQLEVVARREGSAGLEPAFHRLAVAEPLASQRLPEIPGSLFGDDFLERRRFLPAQPFAHLVAVQRQNSVITGGVSATLVEQNRQCHPSLREASSGIRFFLLLDSPIPGVEVEDGGIGEAEPVLFVVFPFGNGVGEVLARIAGSLHEG